VADCPSTLIEMLDHGTPPRPDSAPPVTLRQAQRLLGREMVDSVLEHARHHQYDLGHPWWTDDDLAEAVELVEIERSQEEAP
jgi:hypothetical protein